MEQKRIWRMLPLFLGLAIVLLACARPPQKEMAEARGAIDIAVAAGAETYTPEELKKAREILADAESKVKEKNYKQAKFLFIGARETAERAKEAADKEKKSARKGAENLLTTLRTTLDSTKTLIASVVALKMPATEVAQFKAECDSLDISVSEVQKCVDSEDYKGAINRAEAAMNEGKRLQRVIHATIERVKPRMKK